MLSRLVLLVAPIETLCYGYVVSLKKPMYFKLEARGLLGLWHSLGEKNANAVTMNYGLHRKWARVLSALNFSFQMFPQTKKKESGVVCFVFLWSFS